MLISRYLGGVDIGGTPGRGSEAKTLIVVATELVGKKLGRIRASAIPDASGNSLLGFIEENVEQGSTVITDGWSSYGGLTIKGYAHTIYKQSKAITDDELLPHVHLGAVDTRTI